MRRLGAGWRLASKRFGAWVRAVPAMRLGAGQTLLDGYRWAAGTASGEGRPSLEDAASCAEAAGRKLLAKSLRMLLGPPTMSRAGKSELATDLRGLTPEARRELLRQLLREVEKGGES